MSTAVVATKKRCPRCGELFGIDAVFCPRDGTRLELDGITRDDPYIGQTIAGDVLIKSVAGSGAMGRVYRAHQAGIDRDVAVKVLHKELSGNPQVAQRFHREARIASKLQHPHVVEVYLTGQLPDGAFYIVMEFLEGLSLAAALEQAGGSFPLERALPIALQMCDAVGEGHARGVVHRDLKPENVMLVRRGEIHEWVKVLDFGIAKGGLGEQTMETAAGLIFGTARYISPEGAQGVAVGPPGDVYSLATIVYQMLAGRTPFDAEQPVGLLIKHIHETAPDLKSWPSAKDVPDPVARVIMENLAKDPSKRAQSGRALGAQLSAAAKASHISLPDLGAARPSQLPMSHLPLEPTLDEAASIAPPVIHQPQPPQPTPLPKPAPPTASTPPTEGVAPPPPAVVHRASRAPWVIVFLLLVLLGAVGVVAYNQRRALQLDQEHHAYITTTRRALADSRYVSPPNDCVHDLVIEGLKRWPDDPDLLQIRSTASIELVTRSMVQQKAGDLAGARELAKEATELDPTDHIAALHLKDCDDQLRLLTESGALMSGPPRVIFDSDPAIAKPGERVEISARVIPGAAGPKAPMVKPKLAIYDHLNPVQGTPIPLAASGTTFRAALAAPKVGNYDIVFEVTVEQTTIRAERELGVVAP